MTSIESLFSCTKHLYLHIYYRAEIYFANFTESNDINLLSYLTKI